MKGLKNLKPGVVPMMETPMPQCGDRVDPGFSIG
jgi:hypothetical protein